MGATEKFAEFLKANPLAVGKVVDFDAGRDQVYPLDLTAANAELTEELVANTDAFSSWITQKLFDNNCRYGIGGYMEHRTIYKRSALFDAGQEPRRLHLGVDIWGNAGTPVYVPLDGTIHSFADNNNFGDYGPTIILTHQLDGLTLYSLYGHLSRTDLEGLAVGVPVNKGSRLAAFGSAAENGYWPPHLHFQLMLDIGDAYGDYPGVGKFSEKEMYLQNIPDPNLLLSFSGFPSTFS